MTSSEASSACLFSSVQLGNTDSRGHNNGREALHTTSSGGSARPKGQSGLIAPGLVQDSANNLRVSAMTTALQVGMIFTSLLA